MTAREAGIQHPSCGAGQGAHQIGACAAEAPTCTPLSEMHSTPAAPPSPQTAPSAVDAGPCEESPVLGKDGLMDSMLFKKSEDDLKQIALAVGLCPDDRPRRELLNALQLIKTWYKEPDKLQKEASIHNLPCDMPPTVENLIKHIFGGGAKPEAIPRNSQPCQGGMGTFANTSHSSAAAQHGSSTDSRSTQGPQRTSQNAAPPVAKCAPPIAQSASAAARGTAQEGLQGPGGAGSVSHQPRVAPSCDEFFAEVHRINRASQVDWLQILGMRRGEEVTLQVARSRYRHLMRLLHPDKRQQMAASVVRAGGHQACDQALERVQKANQLAESHLAQMGTGARASTGGVRQTAQGPTGGPPGPPRSPPPAGSARPPPPPPSPPPGRVSKFRPRGPPHVLYGHRLLIDCRGD